MSNAKTPKRAAANRGFSRLRRVQSIAAGSIHLRQQAAFAGVAGAGVAAAKMCYARQSFAQPGPAARPPLSPVNRMNERAITEFLLRASAALMLAAVALFLLHNYLLHWHNLPAWPAGGVRGWRLGADCGVGGAVVVGYF